MRFVIVSCVLDPIGLTCVSICALPTDTPSSPSIDQVEPYSSTAQVQFDEPEATGGVPILKYKAEWRAVGEEAWRFKWYDATEGEWGATCGARAHPLRSPGPGAPTAHRGEVARALAGWGRPDVITCHPVHVSALQQHHRPPRIRAQSHVTQSCGPCAPWRFRTWFP